MPAQDPLGYKRKRSRGSGPQGSGLDPHGPKAYLVSDTHGKDWQVRERGSRSAPRRRRTATPNMGRVVRTLWGPNGPLERTYQRPFGSRRTYRVNRSK